MEQHDINKRFFAEVDLPVPVPSTDVAWEQMQNRLEKEMPQKEKRKKRFFIFFVLLAFLIGPASFFYLNNKSNNGGKIPGEKADIRKDAASTAADNKSSNNNEQEKLQDPQINNTNLADDSKASAATQDVSSLTGEHLKSVNKKNNTQSFISVTQKATTDTKQKKQQSNLQSNKKTTTNKQPIISANEPGADDINKTAIISSQQNINIDITAASANSMQDSSTALTDKTNAAQINKTTDSLNIVISPEEKETKPAEEKAIFKGGLQWNIQIPTAGGDHYFAGGNLKSQPYFFLVPGIWTSVQINRSLFSLEINPYYSSIVPPKTYTESTSSSSNLDTVKIVTESRQLNKLIGTAFAASFGYNIQRNWWLKGGLQMQWWRQGIATANLREEKYPANNSTAKTFSTSSHLFAVENEEWNYFTKFQVNPNIEAVYVFKKWEASLRIGLPIAPITSSGDGPKNSIRTEFILRYQLFKK